MTDARIAAIKDKLAQDPNGLNREDITWLIKRLEELEKENEWLKKELSYSENQGEVGF